MLKKNRVPIILVIVLWIVTPVLILLFQTKTMKRTVTYEEVELTNNYFSQIVSSSDTGIAYIIVYQKPRPYFSGTHFQHTHEFFVSTRHQCVSPKAGDIFFVTHMGEIHRLSNIETSNTNTDVIILLEKMVVQLQNEIAIGNCVEQ